MLLLLRAAIFLILLLSFPAQALPSFAEVKRDYRSSDVIVQDRHGQILQRIRMDKSVRKGDWVTLDTVSPAFRMALVFSEDRRFYEHSGVDWRAVGAATWSNIWNSKTRGASTLTMQLAGLLDENLRQKSGGRTFGQKISQTMAARKLENNWRKDQILEAYINLVPFRGELVGLSSLSQRLFRKYPSGLNEMESAIAAALIRSPNATAPQIAQRACSILKEMHSSTPCQKLDDSVRLVLLPGAAYVHEDENIASHFANKLLGRQKTHAGDVLHSTLDANLQRFATETLSRQLRELSKHNVEDGAVVVIDNLTGDILAWVGSSATSGAADVDGVTALRQPGSTLKPFLYAQAIEEKRLTAASLLDDSSINLPTGTGLYIPRNYDNHFNGWVSLRSALGSSLNIPAVRTGVMVTPEHFRDRLVAAGISLEKSGDYYGFSLALGSADVTLLDLTNAYRTLANQGLHTSTRWLLNEIPGNWRRAYTPASTFIITDILSDRNARTRTFGFDSPLSTRYWTAVKTGTSKDMRDNWCIGYSSRYTVGVWVGNASGASMWDVSGVSGASPVWHSIMDYLHSGRLPSQVPKPPAGVEKAYVVYADKLEPARMEWFLSGTVIPYVTLAHPSPADPGRPHILSPVVGTRFALDPDMPPANQRIWFVADSARAIWQLDNMRLGSGEKIAWMPTPGIHQIALLDAKNNVVETIKFEVRGAGLKDPPPRKKKR